jgi:N-acetylmuramic acid 6-phosphate etherase
MVNMQLTNEKLVDRGVKMLMLKSGLQSYDEAKKILLEHGSVKSALNVLTK